MYSPTLVASLLVTLLAFSVALDTAAESTAVVVVSCALTPVMLRNAHTDSSARSSNVLRGDEEEGEEGVIPVLVLDLVVDVKEAGEAIVDAGKGYEDEAKASSRCCFAPDWLYPMEFKEDSWRYRKRNLS
jgi:hypothetical protein